MYYKVAFNCGDVSRWRRQNRSIDLLLSLMRIKLLALYVAVTFPRH